MAFASARQGRYPGTERQCRILSIVESSQQLAVRHSTLTAWWLSVHPRRLSCFYSDSITCSVELIPANP